MHADIDGLFRIGDVDGESYTECRLEVEVLLTCEISVSDLDIGVGTEKRRS